MDVNNIQFTLLEIKITRFIFKHYGEKYNPRKLAKVLNMNHAHANKLCKCLVKKNLFKIEQIGNATYFSFNYENVFAINFLKYLLSLEEILPLKQLVVVFHALKKFDKYVDLILIFGSSIKNKDFNDIDILLVHKKNKAKTINQIKKEIRIVQLIEKPIRYVDIYEKDIYLNKNNEIFYKILSDSLTVHGAEKYVEVILKCHK
ncbi:hypothetical protein COV11_04130, partial [Candidatus Woesearchaeota archaeon CG10_big_fil_rev_8_21_14_0_10_30_7]